MGDTVLLLGLGKSLSSFWHVLALAAGLVFVVHSYQSLFGMKPYDRDWSRRIARADWHLILSGLAIIAFGMALTGVEKYLSNPKLWTKVTVVVVWLATTALMRRNAARWFATGNTTPMAALASISLACWLYGTFLGCARELAYGAVPFEALLSGFAVTALVTLIAGLALDERRRYRQADRSVAAE